MERRFRVKAVSLTGRPPQWWTGWHAYSERREAGKVVDKAEADEEMTDLDRINAECAQSQGVLRWRAEADPVDGEVG